METWSPDLKLVPGVRSLLVPFVSVMADHNTTAWELCIKILTQFTWTQCYPEPGPGVTTSWWILSKEAPELVSHLNSVGAHARHVLWPLLQCCWTNILPNDDWLQLWDHIITAGPGLVIPSLVATVTCLQTSLFACVDVNMIHDLLTSYKSLNMKQLLTTAHILLEKYQFKINPVLNVNTVFAEKCPPSIKLDNEYKSLLKSMKPNDCPEELNTKMSENVENARLIEEALSVSPPPVPRLHTNSRQSNNTDQGQRQRRVLAPLKPIYETNTFEEKDALNDEWSNVNELLNKAKVMRQVLEARK